MCKRALVSPELEWPLDRILQTDGHGQECRQRNPSRCAPGTELLAFNPWNRSVVTLTVSASGSRTGGSLTRSPISPTPHQHDTDTDTDNGGHPPQEAPRYRYPHRDGTCSRWDKGPAPPTRGHDSIPKRSYTSYLLRKNAD
ncbi:hypothetical protein ACCO45_005396 [Purpureocillium lilacinum]|uniref:Uncharacterized protein n=1 Tax=Purpureocillium lilacinum TaxID=33203 RepID=A0ACC4DWN1_PURLI